MAEAVSEAARPPTDAALQSWVRARPTPLAPGFVAARLARERAKAERLAADAAHPIRRHLSPHRIVPRALALSGLAGSALRNALRIGVTRRTLELPALPRAFDGLRLLHVSDPHFGADTALDAAIVASVAGIEHDLCVMTGDYRYRSFDPIDTAVANVARLREALGEDVLAVLGNHDAIAMAVAFETLGIRVLLNECATFRRDGTALHVAGIDDPHHYRLDDLSRALAARDGRGPARRADAAATILLAHSPERADEAAAAGCDAYLCGHTHGGQVRLPGGGVVLRNARAPTARLSGAWRVGAMRGYTSRGAGVSAAVARWRCPPEITLHALACVPPVR